MRRSLLNKPKLSKSLRQALVLFTLLILPSAAWGQSGTGERNDPYVLSSATDLANFASQYNAGELASDCYVELGDDIDCTGLQGFTPIGSTPQHPFVGTFDGKGKKIIGLTYDAEGNSYYAGLFYVIGSNTASGSVSNLILENCTFQNGNDYNGGIAGTLDNGTIESCTVTSCNILSTDNGPSSGGIVGLMIVGSITNCTVSGSTITATSTIGSSAGGIVAYIDGSSDGSATVSGCQVTGTATNPTTITGSSNFDDSASNCTGGIFGYCSSEHNNINISNNKVSGNTIISSVDNNGGDNTCAGAIVGNKGNSSLRNNYYYYSVTTSTKNGQDAAVEKKGYEQRGSGYVTDQATGDYDITSLNGIVLYTKALTFGGLAEGDETIVSPHYEPLNRFNTNVYAIAPGQEVTVTVTPRAGYQPSVVTLTYAMEENGPQNVVNLTNTDTQSGYKYVIEEMPDAEEIYGATMNITMVPTNYLGLTVAGVPVTSDNANDIFEQSYGEDYPSASYDVTNHILTLNCAHPTYVSGLPFIAIGSDITTLTVHLKGHSDALGYPAIFTAEAECTVNMTTETSIPGRMNINSSSSLTDANVILNYGASGLAKIEDQIEAENGTGNIDYFGNGQFHPNDGGEEGYPHFTYTSSKIWYFSNAISTNNNVELPLTAESSEGTLKMKSSGSDVIKTLTLQCMAISSEDITVTMKSHDGETETTYATGTLTNGVVTLTPNASVTYNDVYLEFSSTSSFSFVPIAVKTEYLVDVPQFIINSENSSTTMEFEYSGDLVRYSIDYVSNDLQDVEESSWVSNDDDEAILLAGPCTVTAFVMKDGVSSETVTGKYFGIADKTIVFNTELKIDDLEIIPATKDEGVSFKFSGVNNSDVIMPSQEGTEYKLSIAGIGICEVDMEISVANPTIQVLNPFEGSVTEVKYAKGVVTVLPDKPTIVKEEKDYLDTDKITITRTSVEGESADNIKIFYTWDADVVVENNSYDDNPDHSDITLSTYDSNNPIIAQSGTLRAWVGYHLGDDEYLMSDVATQAFTVKKDISNYTIQDLETSTPYTGAAIVPTFTVVDQKETELASTNYTVSYQKVETTTGGEGVGSTEKLTDVDEMVEVGSYKIVVTGTDDNYGGSKSVDFEITKADLEIVTIEAIPDQPYTGSEIKPEITVTLNGETVASDGNFYITYSQNTEVSTETYAYVTLTAIGTSECFIEGSTKTASFDIVPRSIEDVTVTMSGDGFDSEKYSFVYNGENQKPTVTVKDGERPLILDTDYTLTNNGGTNVGEYTFTITGKGNYDEDTSIELFYSITPKSIAGATINLDPDNTYVYNGGEQTPVFEVKDGETVLEKDVDYIVSYSNNINAAASTAENAPTFTITGKGNYDENTTAEAFFTINQADLQYAAISKIAFGGTEYSVGDPVEIPYTGEAIQPTVEEVLFNDGTVTLDASEYNVSYSNNTETSSDNLALVIITSKGKNFTAGTSTSQGFKIVPATVTITAEDQAVTYNANAQEYDISKVVVDNENAKVVVTYYATAEDLEGGTALTGAPTDAGTYYVRVTLNEESQQHYVAEPADATFTINQLSLEGAEITLNYTELTYNGNEQTVFVTEVKVNGIVVDSGNYLVDGGNKGTEVGEYTVTVAAMPDNANFKNNFAGYATTKWKINHRTASAAELGFTSETQTFSTYYNPNEDLFLPEGYTSYIITGINDNSVSTQRLTNIPKGIAVLVEKGTNSESSIDAVDNPDQLLLKGTSEEKEVSSISGGTVYVLYNSEFVKSTSGTIPANRCYLLIATSAAAGTRAFGINHHMGANGINGALLNDNDETAADKWYDLQGRSINEPTKAGLYIKNGKKMVKK
jgi:hypothetical protein